MTRPSVSVPHCSDHSTVLVPRLALQARLPRRARLSVHSAYRKPPILLKDCDPSVRVNADQLLAKPSVCDRPQERIARILECAACRRGEALERFPTSPHIPLIELFHGWARIVFADERRDEAEPVDPALIEECPKHHSPRSSNLT